MVNIYADAYLRYSDKNQDELSIEYQMEETQEYADKNGITIRKWYIDRAKSAKKVAGRDEFYNYIETVRNGTAAGCLLVWRTNRAFRNSYESHIYRKLLRENNIKLVSATQQIDEDSSSGRLVTNILADIDQYKSEEIGDHVVAASRSLVKRNPKVYMGQIPIFGYTVKPWKDGDANRQEYAVNEEESPIVKKIYDDFINGASIFSIVEWMNGQGFRTRRGKKWSYQTLRELIKNDFYKGVRTYMKKSDDPLIFPNGVDAIIDPVTWDLAQTKFRKAQKGAGAVPRTQRNGKVYALTGKISCGICNGNITGSGCKGYDYYTCYNMGSRKTCNCKRIRKDIIEQYVLRQIREHILNPQMVDEIAYEALKAFDKIPSVAQDRATLEAQKAKIVSDLSELVQMKLDKEISPEVYNTMKKDKDSALVEIEKNLLLLENMPQKPTEKEVLEKIKHFITEAETADVQNGASIKALFDLFVESVVVTNESVDITLLFPSLIFSHSMANGSPVITLSKNYPYSVIKPERRPYDEWNWKKK